MSRDSSIRDCQTGVIDSINQLPDELLLDIFSRAVDGLSSALSLTHVCRRFRELLLSSATMWQRYVLNSKCDYEQVASIAEWSGLQNLKCTIDGDYDLLLTESAAYILSLAEHITELRFTGLSTPFECALQEHMAGRTFTALRTLAFSGSPFVNSPMHFYAECHMPCLRVLDADFVPLPSLAVTLTRFSLEPVVPVLLSSLLNFLSLSDSLRDLHIQFSRTGIIDEEDVITFPVVTLPNVVTFDLSMRHSMSVHSALLLVNKIRPSALRRLMLEIYEDPATEHIFVGFIQAFPLLQDLTLKYRPDRRLFLGIDIARIFCCIPRHLEKLKLSVPSRFLMFSWNRSLEDFKAYHLRYVRIENGHLQEYFFERLSDFIRDVGLNGIRIEFMFCTGASPKDCAFPYDFQSRPGSL